MTIEGGRRFSGGMIDRSGLTGKAVKGTDRRRSQRRVSHKLLVGVFAGLGVLVALAVAFVPTSNSIAKPTYENLPCSNCHTTVGNFVTVTGLPVSQYNPGEAYRITITLSDPDGSTVNENAFDFTLSSGGGTLTLGSPVDPNVEINSALEASSNDAVSPMRTHTWNFTWTAPLSGSVTINVWGVVGGFGGSTNTGTKAPYDHDTYTLGSTAIPEFSVFIVPVVGMAGAIIAVSRLTKNKRNQ